MRYRFVDQMVSLTLDGAPRIDVAKRFDQDDAPRVDLATGVGS